MRIGLSLSSLSTERNRANINPKSVSSVCALSHVVSVGVKESTHRFFCSSSSLAAIRDWWLIPPPPSSDNDRSSTDSAVDRPSSPEASANASARYVENSKGMGAVSLRWLPASTLGLRTSRPGRLPVCVPS